LNKTAVVLVLMLNIISSCASSIKTEHPTSAIRTIFSSLPASIFDHTTEGISKEEMSVLSYGLDSKNWKVSAINSNQLSVQCKHPSSTLRLFTYPMGENRAVVIYTDNGGSSDIQTWTFNSSNKTVSKRQLLPKVSINDFYAKSEKLENPQRYNGNIIVTLEIDGTLVYEINSWMDERLGQKVISYDLSAVWDGQRFTLKKSASKAYKTFY